MSNERKTQVAVLKIDRKSFSFVLVKVVVSVTIIHQVQTFFTCDELRKGEHTIYVHGYKIVY